MNICPPPSRAGDQPVRFGTRTIDRRLTHGLARGVIHEVYADADDAGSGLGFTLLLARLAAAERPIVVVRDDRCVKAWGRLYGEGLVDLGLDPAALIVFHTPDDVATLHAATEAATCRDLGAVIVEPWQAAELTLTTSRRLALRAESSGVFVLVARVGTVPVASAATTRWQVRSSLSTPLAAHAPGDPAFAVNLLRHRGGIAGFETRVEWDRDRRSFRDAPLSGHAPAVVAGRPGTADRRRAA